MNVTDTVAKGVAILDTRGPAGWVQVIDLDALDMEQGNACVLGQLYRDNPEDYDGFLRGVSTLSPYNIMDGEYWNTHPDADLWGVQNGFNSLYEHNNTVYDTDEPDTARVYEALTAEWRKVIRARRDGETVAPTIVEVPLKVRENDVLAAMFREFESTGVVIPSSAVLRIVQALGVVVE
jgi:hypothetical protein